MTKKSTTPTVPDEQLPLAPTPDEAEVAEVQAGAAQGIDYTDRFTLEDAARSFNATRQAIALPDGTSLPAERQHFRQGPEWFARHAGTFQVRIPGIYDEIAMRVDRDKLVGLLPLTPGTDWLVDATVMAKHLVVESPDWFDLDKPGLDPDVLYMIHHWWSQWRARFQG